MSQQLALVMARALPAESGSAVPGPCQQPGASERHALEPAPCPEGQARGNRANRLEFVAVERLVGLDDDVIDAELIDEAHHLLLGAGRNGQHGHDGANAEDHAQHGEQAAELVGEEAGQPHHQFGKNIG